MRYFGIFASIYRLFSFVQLVKILDHSNWELETQKMEDLVRSHGRVVIGVNASSLFSNMEQVASASPHESFRGWYGRLQGIRISSFALRHSFQVTNYSSSGTHSHVDLRGRSTTRLDSF